MNAIAVFTYLFSMTAANISVSTFGPAVIPLNAFLLIGMDMSIRDWLHYRISPLKMGALIISAGAISYALDRSAQSIAVASSLSFGVSSIIDWIVFSRLSGSWLFRSNGSNVAGAAADSFLFQLIAFGSVLPEIVLMQFVAKVAGGSVWSIAINRFLKRYIAL